MEEAKEGELKIARRKTDFEGFQGAATDSFLAIPISTHLAVASSSLTFFETTPLSECQPRFARAS